MINLSVASIKSTLKSAKQWVRYQTLPSSTPTARVEARGDVTCLISAADPGGLGDAAMVRAITDHYGSTGVDVTAWRPDSPRFPSTRGSVDVRQLQGSDAERTLRGYGRLGCVGADVMDGLYSYSDSCLRLRLLGLAAEMGLDARLFGFSFNATPHPRAAVEFQRLHRNVVVCARDPISFQRLQAVTDHDLRLVADLAFLVKPAEPDGEVRAAIDWIQAQKQRGQRVIGVNIHPMFSFDHGPGITKLLVDSFSRLLASSAAESFVLIPHDFRPVFGDVPTQQAIVDGLPPDARARVQLVTDIRDPAVLKGFVAHLDGVLTGRMHLAIAAMGQGVSVAGVTYQGKFEGLLRHFELDEGLTISPPDATDADRLQVFYAQWLRRLDTTATAIRQNLPRVSALSRLNFS